MLPPPHLLKEEGKTEGRVGKRTGGWRKLGGGREREKDGRMDGRTDGCHKHPPKISTYSKL